MKVRSRQTLVVLGVPVDRFECGNVVATFADQVAGRAITTLQFATFNLAKPSLARLMSVDDKIELEIEFRCRRSAL